MKESLDELNSQNENLNEIFGKIAKFFGLSKDDGITGSYQNKGERIPVNLSRKDKAEFRKKAGEEYLSKIEKYTVGNLLNPSKCDPHLPSGSTSNVRRSMVSMLPSGEVMIERDKVIKDYSQLYIENLIRGKASGSFRKINVKDFVCYDLDKDYYGIAWLLKTEASYIAEKISGKLFFNVPNQKVNFEGDWQSGKFYGKISGSQALNRLKQPVSKKEIYEKFQKLTNLIKQTKTNFEVKLSLEDFNEIQENLKQSKDERLKTLFLDILQIRKYLSTFSIQQGAGNSPYIKSSEISNLRSQIDNDNNLSDNLADIEEMNKKFVIIDSKINKFKSEYDKLLSKISSSNQSGGQSGTPIKV